jgi:DNA polymerase
LYRHATQAVFGEGRPGAAVMLVGEQPGDAEDLAGRPFVGPAGALLAATLAEASLARQDIYLTNAVKHFGFEQRGKHRLHKKPDGENVRACRPWLFDEVTLVGPRVIVALGATAASALFGPTVRLTRDRGRALSLPASPIQAAAPAAIKLVTFHPSAVLRAPTSERRSELREMLTSDLALAQRLAARAIS